MMIKRLITFAIFGFYFCSFARADVAISKRWRGDQTLFALQIAEEVRLLVEEHFSSLRNLPIEVIPLNSKSDFFRTQPFMREKSRIYGLWANPYLMENSPGEEAIRAILVHELTHIEYASRVDVVKLIGYAVRYALSDSFVTRVERETDRAALEKGFAEGLKQYRIWLYDQISEDDRDVKMRHYFTPDEIDDWMVDRSI